MNIQSLFCWFTCLIFCSQRGSVLQKRQRKWDKVLRHFNRHRTTTYSEKISVHCKVCKHVLQRPDSTQPQHDQRQLLWGALCYSCAGRGPHLSGDSHDCVERGASSVRREQLQTRPESRSSSGDLICGVRPSRRRSGASAAVCVSERTEQTAGSQGTGSRQYTL